jgi:hypothetical protein
MPPRTQFPLMAPTGLTMKDVSALFHWSGTQWARTLLKKAVPDHDFGP